MKPILTLRTQQGHVPHVAFRERQAINGHLTGRVLCQTVHALLLAALLIAAIAYGVAHAESADAWPKVAFAEWPSIPISKIKAQEPAVFPMGVPGSIQPKPKPAVPVRRTCQQKQPDGYFLPVAC